MSEQPVHPIDPVDISTYQDVQTYEDFYVSLRKRIDRQVTAWRDRGSRSAQLSKLIELLLFLPDLFHLSVRLVFDGTVAPKRKGALVAGIVYVLSPLDLIPDSLPLLGWVDDLVVMTLALNTFLATSDEVTKAAIDRHWVGDDDLLGLLKHVLEVGEGAIDFLPNQFIKLVKPIFGDPRFGTGR